MFSSIFSNSKNSESAIIFINKTCLSDSNIYKYTSWDAKGASVDIQISGTDNKS